MKEVIKQLEEILVKIEELDHSLQSEAYRDKINYAHLTFEDLIASLEDL